jgi:hypothetical protein
MNAYEGTVLREAWSNGSTSGKAKGKTAKGQEEADMGGNENRGTKRTCNGALDHVLVATRAGRAQRSWARTERQG